MILSDFSGVPLSSLEQIYTITGSFFCCSAALCATYSVTTLRPQC